MPDSVGAGGFPRNINIGHEHLDLSSGFTYQYQGGVPTDVLNWKIINGVSATDPSPLGWGTKQLGAMWFNNSEKVYKFWDGVQVKTLGVSAMAQETFLVNGTFTVPANITTIYLTGCAGGGGGAGGHSADPGGGGGGGEGGESISMMPVTVTPGSILTITIGAGGVGGIAGAAGNIGANTTIAGLPIGTYTILGGRPIAGAASAGTVTNGGAGGVNGIGGGGGATGTGTGAASNLITSRNSGGDLTYVTGGGAGGGATGPGAGGPSQYITGYGPLNPPVSNTAVAGGAASGTKGGGGAGGSSLFGVGGAGGSNSVGSPGTGFGSGGGGGAATFAGGNGMPGMLVIRY